MRYAFLLILSVTTALWATTLLNVNVYERQTRVDLMLSFDTPFEGKIKKRSETADGITFLLEGVRVTQPFYKSLRNRFLDAVAVTRSGEESALVKLTTAKTPVRVHASRTVDGYGLRLRIQPRQSVAGTGKTTAATASAASRTEPLELKSDDLLPGWRYWLVIAILFTLVVLMWLAKRRSLQKAGAGTGWLMPGIPAATAGSGSEEAIVRFQKPLDAHNRLVLLEYGDRQYLLIIGNSNLHLETFTQGKITEESDFVKLYEANRQRLDRFIKNEIPDAYEAFKQNASKEEHL